MDNARIAEVLSEIAVLLEIKGENPFKGRSYERAAEAVANLTQGAEQVRAEKGGLQALPGVGKSIAEKIEELLDTGKCSYHQELLTEIPATVFDMLR
ncbi:MAG: DNA polymerase/3'-5' exonuclease PolX, partial [Armatimonadetes bacterium]|nr:DNA polymerase/3'-5' exonuclease PolX [Armatimonadota bacterium]